MNYIWFCWIFFVQLTKNVMSVNLRVEHYVNMNKELKTEVAVLKDQLRAMEQALKHPAVSPPRADSSYVEKLNTLYREKRKIHMDWLNLEAQLKLLQWRIRCKTLAANQMKNQMNQYGVDYNQVNPNFSSDHVLFYCNLELNR